MYGFWFFVEPWVDSFSWEFSKKCSQQGKHTLLWQYSLFFFGRVPEKRPRVTKGERELQVLITVVVSYWLIEFQVRIFHECLLCESMQLFKSVTFQTIWITAKAKPTLTVLYPQVNLNLEKWRLFWHSLKTSFRNLSHLTTVSSQKFIPSSVTKKRKDRRDQVQTLTMPWLYSKRTGNIGNIIKCP